ncbi:LacI family transcriptional regulator [Mesobacillus maritimus]|uniref:LacI family DNA-binding transcriptional regulator n=1 Tax=Mesobacillus maritimus TaxID=1643336 RepID=UPI00203E78FA|nr:LacI family DNA-binding transcriptional regulator [Mesobacillus maritimus]MCM3585352.1 LacI family transcriptional regulator [Mesobacillus maritimus]MCM3668234.1 LacI family transcriptional regulator [Mesobacillus maritimus]
MATIKDVAKKAGVSIGIVSKAFNNYPDVSEKTRQRILDIAKEMNYTPNVVAKNLSSKRQLTIGMITSGLLNMDGKDNFNLFNMYKGAYSAVEEKYELAYFFTDSVKQKEKSYAQFCRERNIGGAILQGISVDDPYFKELVDTNIPCVLIDLTTESDKEGLIGNVSTNNYEASREVANYLIESNHRKIVIMAGKVETVVNTERLSGVMAAFKENGLELKEEDVLHANFSEEQAYLMAKEYLKTKQPTAFLCFSDLMAFGVMKAVKESGLRIPEDISITGFDGLIIAEYTQPLLTTVRQDFFEIGKQAATLLQEMMEQKSTKQRVFVPHELIKRESVKTLSKE